MRPRTFDKDGVDDVLRLRERVATHATLRELGVPMSTITRWIGPRGPWQRLLPGVVLGHRGTPTRREQLLGALAFAGDGAVVTGIDALRAAGAKLSLERGVHVLTPNERQRTSFGFVRVERTRRLPKPIVRKDIPYASVARATVDAARHQLALDAVRELVATVVQDQLVSLSQLREELNAAARQRTALPRAVLNEVGDGVRSVAEARAKTLVAGLDVPPPLWNATLLDASGKPFLTPDAFWPEFSAALEIDSRAWHLRPKDWDRTRRRQRRMTIGGVSVIGYSPMEILEEPEEVGHEIVAFLLQVGRRPMPPGMTYRRAE